MVGPIGSEYLQWVKTRKPAKFNLASSGVLPCELKDLDVRIEEFEINGPGLYGFEPLQHAIARHCGVPAEFVVAASGTSMANFIAMAAMIGPGDEVLIEYPAYEPLLAAAQYFHAEIKRFPREAPLSNFLSSRTRLIVITNLHNPTCARLNPQQVKKIGEAAKSVGAHVLMDEVYLECLYGERSSAIHEGPQFVSTGSLTKAYGVGGLRCGWILATPDLAWRMWQVKDLIDPSAPHPSEILSVITFQKLDRLAARAKVLIDTNRELVREFFRSCPQLEVAMPDYGTCIFPKIKSGSPDGFFELLHDRYETDVVPGRFFEMPDHFRIGIGGESGMFAEGLRRLEDALSIQVE
jgi:aspartate/methionine/tyrosine aminotransferase